jgi:phosphate starvation-inducible PhoH-like protein
LSEINLTIEGVDLIEFYGENNAKLNLLKEAFPQVKITSRGNTVKLSGEKKDTQTVKSKLELMLRTLKEYKELSAHTILDMLEGENPFDSKIPGDKPDSIIVYGRDSRPIKARTLNQKRLVEAIEDNDVVFAIGPAGTGKTYTAVAMAVRALKNRLVKKIILTRPAVEAGENLGFLPGDLKEKVDPYLRPLYDALDDLLPAEKLNYFMNTRVIEIAPLAFMRGRTLDNAFVILDEAQNATTVQIKMFLTRLGPSAKAVITGDLSQIDLPHSQRSGLYRALDILGDINGIATVRMDAEDVMRHRLVKSIINAYDDSDKRIKAEKEARDKERAEQAAKEDGAKKEV